MRIAITVFLISLPLVAQCEVYRWMDENGQVHYGSVPPTAQKPYKPGDFIEDTKARKDSPTGNSKKNHSSGNVDPVTKPDNEKHSISNTNMEGEKSSIQNQNKKEIEESASQDSQKNISVKTEDKNQEKIIKEKLDNLIIRLKKDISVLPKKETIKLQKEKIPENKKIEKEMTPDDNVSAIKKETKEGKNGIIKNKNDIEKNEKAREALKNKTQNESSMQSVGENSGDKSAGDRNNKVKGGLETSKETESVEQAAHKGTDEEKCGFFMSYVDNYTYRIKYECPSDYCDLLKSKLEKYSKKVSQYCDDEPGGNNSNNVRSTNQIEHNTADKSRGDSNQKDDKKEGD